MKNVNPSVLSITLTEWPAVVTICFGIAVLSGTVIYLGTKLIDNGYEITSKDGINVTRRDDDPPEYRESCEEAA